MLVQLPHTCYYCHRAFKTKAQRREHLKHQCYLRVAKKHPLKKRRMDGKRRVQPWVVPKLAEFQHE